MSDSVTESVVGGFNARNPGAEERNWSEDFSYENGCYENICSFCRQHFLGYKRRYVCKKCVTPQPTPLPTIYIDKAMAANKHVQDLLKDFPLPVKVIGKVHEPITVLKNQTFTAGVTGGTGTMTVGVNQGNFAVTATTNANFGPMRDSRNRAERRTKKKSHGPSNDSKYKRKEWWKK